MTTASDLAAGQWTATGALPSPGCWHGQHDGPIVLPSGKVLVAGGADAGATALATAALYDPDAGTWAATGALATARRLHTLTALPDGRVLAAGGVTGAPESPAPGLASAEIYDPGTGTWSVTGAMHGRRWGHSAVALPDGTVLVAGGTTIRSAQSTRSLSTAEIYDPATEEWTEAAPMTEARAGHPAVLLANGRVLVAGGSATTGPGQETALAFCELYDPATGVWTPTGSLATPRGLHQATRLTDGTVLVTGGGPAGAGGDGTFAPFSLTTAERYNPGSGQWTAAPPMAFGRGGHRAVPLSGGRLLVIGGAGGPAFDVGYQNAALFDAAAGTWTPTGGLTSGRLAFAAAALPDGRVLVAGGVVRSGPATAEPGTDVLAASAEIFAAGAEGPG
ncbi:Kelch repeat-containing protein [Streptomyces litchfieldiae]|uniref:Kelch repeat-containing protein n=1 Tax=Streptomyces litchfieldiae TaxID=3075543 RepID=A0ABU2N0N8_9ACTN|nr:kelch repeat-containing protein [Streptomyces sp. DSM 44938]MDT0347463.1 kelch repeat-containing protein [Streptomyces sp. DSM 44938]